MTFARPIVSVFPSNDSTKAVSSIPLPTVFVSPLRHDLVRYVFTNMSKNKRQAYGVSTKAGHQHSAESWGTGRAVARIPRVSASGTSRSEDIGNPSFYWIMIESNFDGANRQGAFGNMCRGGHMFSPNKTYRRFHRKINTTEKRHAVAAAIAATGCPSLVMARGHRINNVPELPLVISNEIQNINKTSAAVEFFKNFGLEEEMKRIESSIAIRCGKGKMRNRRRVCAVGPLIVYAEDNGIVKAMRNIKGVDTCSVERLNLLRLAPGGTFGRLTIFTKDAIKRLQEIYGSYTHGSSSKVGYTLPRPAMTNADISRIINSTEVQSVLRPLRGFRCMGGIKRTKTLKNNLTNLSKRACLNPAYTSLRKSARLAQIPGTRLHAIKQRQKAANRALKKSIKQKSETALAAKALSGPNQN
ncbi:60s ribosomal protein [Cryptosporidium ubiquitum]|uniref:60s ribosomal protein n=1 Tax=Cryptosporidium ubiquitum TaxID=857276 RepID=A0A1J4MG90_9CRYT|nr:60s ribosomal protein [Cryptosporidium ubiquitum]OII73216.1 60s ribosomal protein [Cryptosporidium ubiquitum]